MQLLETCDKYELKKIETHHPKIKITCSRDMANLGNKIFGDSIGVRESIYALFLNRGNMVVGFFEIGKVGLSSVVCDLKLLASHALYAMAHNVILIHNHPSGGSEPSKEDDKVTQNIAKGLKVLQIGVLDHIILTEDQENYYSYADMYNDNLQVN